MRESPRPPSHSPHKNYTEIHNVSHPEQAQADDEKSAERETLLAGLNHDLAGEYQAVLMYTHFSAKLTGPYRRELRTHFQHEVGEELGHAQFLADKIVALGGEPTTTPREVPYCCQPREMLEHALDAETRAVADYSERVRQTEEYGDIGLKVVLENQIADETRHKEEIDRILAGWNELNLERARNEDRWQDDGGPG